jgi:O-antigen ligase
MIFPFALFFLWYEKSWLRRLVAAGCAVLILAAVVLSYSRGAFATLAVLVLLLALLRRERRLPTLAGAAMLLVLVVALAPGYRGRVTTMLGVHGLFSDQAVEQQLDGAVRGRTTEMLAAVYVFLDHPVFGVGPAQYSPFYSMSYHMNPEIAFRYLPRTRRAHSLYAELAAETGIVGMSVFLSIVGWLLYQLWQASRRWVFNRPDLANLATTFLFSIGAYLGTALFLHLSYERYYWLLLALASAALQIGSEEYRSMRSLSPAASFSPSRRKRWP